MLSSIHRSLTFATTYYHQAYHVIQPDFGPAPGQLTLRSAGESLIAMLFLISIFSF